MARGPRGSLTTLAHRGIALLLAKADLPKSTRAAGGRFAGAQLDRRGALRQLGDAAFFLPAGRGFRAIGALERFARLCALLAKGPLSASVRHPVQASYAPRAAGVPNRVAMQWPSGIRSRPNH